MEMHALRKTISQREHQASIPDPSSDSAMTMQRDSINERREQRYDRRIIKCYSHHKMLLLKWRIKRYSSFFSLFLCQQRIDARSDKSSFRQPAGIDRVPIFELALMYSNPHSYSSSFANLTTFRHACRQTAASASWVANRMTYSFAMFPCCWRSTKSLQRCCIPYNRHIMHLYRCSLANPSPCPLRNYRRWRKRRTWLWVGSSLNSSGLNFLKSNTFFIYYLKDSPIIAESTCLIICNSIKHTRESVMQRSGTSVYIGFEITNKWGTVLREKSNQIADCPSWLFL